MVSSPFLVLLWVLIDFWHHSCATVLVTLLYGTQCVDSNLAQWHSKVTHCLLTLGPVAKESHAAKPDPWVHVCCAHKCGARCARSGTRCNWSNVRLWNPFAGDHRPEFQFQMHSGDFPFCSANKIEKHKWLQTEGCLFFLFFYSFLYFIDSKIHFFPHFNISKIGSILQLVPS